MIALLTQESSDIPRFMTVINMQKLLTAWFTTADRASVILSLKQRIVFLHCQSIEALQHARAMGLWMMTAPRSHVSITTGAMLSRAHYRCFRATLFAGRVQAIMATFVLRKKIGCFGKLASWTEFCRSHSVILPCNLGGAQYVTI